LPAPPTRWADRLLAQNLRAPFLRAFQAEAFLHTHSHVVEVIRRAPGFNDLSGARYSERVLRTAEMLRDRTDPCSIDSSLGLTAMATLRRAWVAMTMTRFDGEFTRLVMEARRDSRDLAHANASPVASTVCNGVKWRRTNSGDGSMTIAATPARFRDDVSKRVWTFTFRTTS
jgi:hypothetical protein